jgi:hypothetical protein
MNAKGAGMKKINVEMPVVSHCRIAECTYNKDLICRAKAITIGDSTDPECDTFLRSTLHIRETRRVAGVGACKVAGCIFNRDFECSADEITVGWSGAKVHCLTYSPEAE